MAPTRQPDAANTTQRRRFTRPARGARTWSGSRQSRRALARARSSHPSRPRARAVHQHVQPDSRALRRSRCCARPRARRAARRATALPQPAHLDRGEPPRHSCASTRRSGSSPRAPARRAARAASGSGGLAPEAEPHAAREHRAERRERRRAAARGQRGDEAGERVEHVRAEQEVADLGREVGEQPVARGLGAVVERDAPRALGAATPLRRRQSTARQRAATADGGARASGCRRGRRVDLAALGERDADVQLVQPRRAAVGRGARSSASHASSTCTERRAAERRRREAARLGELSHGRAASSAPAASRGNATPGASGRAGAAPPRAASTAPHGWPALRPRRRAPARAGTPAGAREFARAHDVGLDLGERGRGVVAAQRARAPSNAPKASVHCMPPAGT